MPGIYLVKIVNVTTSALNLRIGYYGICVAREGYTQCLATSHGTTGTVIEEALAGSPGFNSTLSQSFKDKIERTDTYRVALEIQSSIFAKAQTGSAVVSGAALFTLLLQHQARRHANKLPSPTRDLEAAAQKRNIILDLLEKSTLVLFAFAALLSLIAAISTMQTANALQFATTNFSPLFSMRAGTAVTALQWLLFVSLATLCGVLGVWMPASRSRSGAAAEDDKVPLVHAPATPAQTPAPESPSPSLTPAASVSPRFGFPAPRRPRPAAGMVGPPRVAGAPIPSRDLPLGRPRIVVPARLVGENGEDEEPEAVYDVARCARVIPAGAVRVVDIERNPETR
ncbi:hypothetical protein B0H67DRAFT_642422 [Lasiosphaeris hirsuta]|uniref:Uncharacterized protein n=1 Tax=Lasiosphaeris hirsuta TaxID=260670 RepID=A0AA40B1X9_9PEZI|nr:hypothetical protein B0H67DRAFT_642422 [Lasiosphaeris hirsuta]